jgi:Flp pilus assembly protein TadG
MSIRKRSSEKGASLVEFAFVAPILILLVLGIVEFGYVFTEYNEVKHAAREGARYAAVSHPDRNGGGVDYTDVVDSVCGALTLVNSTVTVSASVVSGSGDKGDLAQIEVTATIASLSGLPMMNVLLPAALTSEVEFRLEQNRKWATFSNEPCS